MTRETVYLLMLGGYVAAVLGVGVFTARMGKKGSSGYFLGGRSVGPWVTAFSFIAAYFSSVLIIGGGAFGYKYGMATLWVGAINVLVGCFLVWAVLGPPIRRMSKRLNCLTVPDFFAERFRSPTSRLFSAGTIIVFLVIYNVSVLKGMGNALEVLMRWDYTLAVVVSGVVILLYVSVGGYLAVVWTSFVQAWVMIFALIFLTVFALIEVGGVAKLNEGLRAVDVGLWETPGTWGWAGLISFSLIVSFGVWGMPQLLVRFYSIKDTKLLRLGTVLATVGGSIAFLPYLNGCAARVLYPNLASLYPDVPAKQVPDLAIPHLVRDVLPSWAGGLLLAGVIAAGMSTFASILIIVSSAVVRDVVQKGMKREISEEKVVWWGRVVSIAAGGVSLLIALRPPALILVITAFSWAIIASTNLWPILFGVYWRRASRAGVVASMICGAGTALIWQALGKWGVKAVADSGIHGFIPGLGAALLVLVGVSLLTTPPPAEEVDRAFGAKGAAEVS